MTKLSLAATAALVLSMTVAGCGGGKDEKKVEPAAAPPKGGTPAAPAAPMGEVKVDPATAGTITCKVLWKGAAPKLKELASDKEPKCIGIHKGPIMEEHTLVGDGGALANVIVSIKTGPAVNVKSPAPTTTVVLDQAGCVYIPHVFAMRAGQPFELKTSDPFGHNVHNKSELNGGGNVTMNPNQPNIKQSLMFPEIFQFQCEVHPWMNATVGVFGHNYFGVSGKDGMVSMKDVPPGDYTLEAKHEKWGTQKATCKVTDKGDAAVTFTFSDDS